MLCQNMNFASLDVLTTEIFHFFMLYPKVVSWQCAVRLVWLEEDAQHLVMLPGPAQPSSMLVLSPDPGQTLIWL